MPPALSIQHTEDIAFTEDFTSIIPVSLTELTRPYCRCGNRVDSAKEKPTRGRAGFSLDKLEDRLKTPVGANVSTGIGHQPNRWIAVGANKKVITKTLGVA